MRHPDGVQHPLSTRHRDREKRRHRGALAGPLLETLLNAAAEAFGRRLDAGSSRPLAVAVSGGADSMAAVIVAASWARTVGRPLVVLSVDHRLQPQSERWTAFVGQTASRLDADFRALAWTAPKPATGLAAAARAARHRLLADAARDVGASVLITGHTASDARENALLGQGRLEEWSPSPVWPEGRGLFLHRPLLTLTREAIREALGAARIAYVDDPANEDASHPRVRARRSAALAEAPPPRLPCAADLAARVECLAGGSFRLDRPSLLQADPGAARRLLAAALTSAGGGQRPARASSVEALLARLAAPGPVTATLAGARLVAGETILVARDVGERRRGRLAAVALPPGKRIVWDGRYEVETARVGRTVDVLSGHAARLPSAERAFLAGLPAASRPALPVILSGETPTCPILSQAPADLTLRDLTGARFLGACGAIAHESDLAQGAHGARPAGVLCSSPVMK